MNRKAVLLAIVLSLMVMLLATSVVAAGNGNPQNGSLPHDGGCASYCARAVVYINESGGRDEIDNWVPFDLDNDGTVENCLREFVPGSDDPAYSMMCHKATPVGVCPEMASNGVDLDRCIDPMDYPTDAVGGPGQGEALYWCRLMHGKDTHSSPMPTGPFPAVPGTW